MRVLVVTVVHDPEDARIRHRQIPALLDAGHQVVYAAPFTAFHRTPPGEVSGIELPRAHGRRRLGAVLAARRLLARMGGSADVVLLHDPDLLAAVAGLRGLPAVVWDVHEDTAAALSMRAWAPGWAHGLLAWAVRAAERFAERRYHLLLAERGYAERFVREHPVVPNTVRVPASAPVEPGSDRVVYLGKVSMARGAQEMVGLAAVLPAGLRVQILGSADGVSAPLLEQARDAGDISWPGFVPNDEAVQLLDGATAGLSLLQDEPNYAHSEPTKIMEYMAHGIPVITTPNPASVELVRRADAGVVVPFGDAAAAAAAIEELANDHERRRRLGAHGHRYAREHLDWDKDGPRFVAALEKAAASGGVPRSA